uniref:TNFR-Cys domain-containing protein n=1 Tax=Denticeps clupeoides TaxID=299321 RepID=A0AAY4CM62_9TELE
NNLCNKTKRKLTNYIRRITFTFHFVPCQALPSCVDSCDTQTEYLKDGECCNMCGPGTRMTDSAICRDPYCKDCEEDEYQAGFTKETRCRRQPSCDPNVHLEPVLPRTTKIFSPCKCLKGYHCSSESCTSCNKDTVCGPGYEVSRNDTECKPCPHGTFSNASSYESRCRQSRSWCTWELSDVCSHLRLHRCICRQFWPYVFLVDAAICK